MMTILQENGHLPHGEMIMLANKTLNQFKLDNEMKQQKVPDPDTPESNIIKPGNYRTVPCRNFHGPNGCTRGDFCHFIHAAVYDGKARFNVDDVVNSVGRELPREVF